MKKLVFFLLIITNTVLLAETATFHIGARSYTLRIEDEYIGDYDRDNWNHWISLENSNFTIRDKVLQEESLIPVVVIQSSSGRDRVTQGLWICPFTGETLTDWRQIDIDHVVPLKEAYDSGGWKWTKEKKETYANFLEFEDHLIAVKASANRSKGAQDPFEWLPSNQDFRACHIFCVNDFFPFALTA